MIPGCKIFQKENVGNLPIQLFKQEKSTFLIANPRQAWCNDPQTFRMPSACQSFKHSSFPPPNFNSCADSGVGWSGTAKSILQSKRTRQFITLHRWHLIISNTVHIRYHEITSHTSDHTLMPPVSQFHFQVFSLVSSHIFSPNLKSSGPLLPNMPNKNIRQFTKLYCIFLSGPQKTENYIITIDSPVMVDFPLGKLTNHRLNKAKLCCAHLWCQAWTRLETFVELLHINPSGHAEKPWRCP